MARKIIPPTAEEDRQINRGIAADPDMRELTDADFARMRPVREVFPELAKHAEKRRRGQRGPQKDPVKKPVKLRIDPDVLACYKATGPGFDRKKAKRAADGLREASKGVMLRGLKIKDLINEGRP